jgi:hypothetical protein
VFTGAYIVGYDWDRNVHRLAIPPGKYATSYNEATVVQEIISENRQHLARLHTRTSLPKYPAWKFDDVDLSKEACCWKLSERGVAAPRHRAARERVAVADGNNVYVCLLDANHPPLHSTSGRCAVAHCSLSVPHRYPIGIEGMITTASRPLGQDMCGAL